MCQLRSVRPRIPLGLSRLPGYSHPSCTQGLHGNFKVLHSSANALPAWPLFGQGAHNATPFTSSSVQPDLIHRAACLPLCRNALTPANVAPSTHIPSSAALPRVSCCQASPLSGFPPLPPSDVVTAGCDLPPPSISPALGKGAITSLTAAPSRRRQLAQAALLLIEELETEQKQESKRQRVSISQEWQPGGRASIDQLEESTPSVDTARGFTLLSPGGEEESMAPLPDLSQQQLERATLSFIEELELEVNPDPLWIVEKHGTVESSIQDERDLSRLRHQKRTAQMLLMELETLQRKGRHHSTTRSDLGNISIPLPKGVHASTVSCATASSGLTDASIKQAQACGAHQQQLCSGLPPLKRPSAEATKEHKLPTDNDTAAKKMVKHQGLVPMVAETTSKCKGIVVFGVQLVPASVSE